MPFFIPVDDMPQNGLMFTPQLSTDMITNDAFSHSAGMWLQFLTVIIDRGLMGSVKCGHMD